MFGAKVLQEAWEHAAAVYPHESCGLVAGGTYYPCFNGHSEPEKHFEISPRDYLFAEKHGLQAVIHSHPDGKDHPTYQDMKCQIETGLPWCILPKGKPVFWFGDGTPIPPLFGRVFRHGVTDCYASIRDWYRLERNIVLPEYPRDYEWWDAGQNLYLDNFEAAGFKRLSADEPLQAGDGLLASIRSRTNTINHAAIFLGDDTIFHHLCNRLSVREPLTRWRKYFVIAVRYAG